MKKKVKVVMLPTEKDNDGNTKQVLLDNLSNDMAYDYQAKAKEAFGYKVQHLYLVSDEETKEGDYFYNSRTNRVFKNQDEEDAQITNQDDTCKKVIATTDKSLLRDLTPDEGKMGLGMSGFMLPQIPESFIKAYVEANGEIDEVMVEYEEVCKGCGAYSATGKRYCSYPVPDSHDRTLTSKLKTREDNTVIISHEV